MSLAPSFPPHQPLTPSSLSLFSKGNREEPKDNVKDPKGGCGEYDLGLENSRKATGQ